MQEAPLRRVVQFAECRDVLAKKRIVKMKLECHHEIYRHDEYAHAEQRQACEDCKAGKKPKGISKRALARWGL